MKSPFYHPHTPTPQNCLGYPRAVHRTWHALEYLVAWILQHPNTLQSAFAENPSSRSPPHAPSETHTAAVVTPQHHRDISLPSK